jgi:lysophospholipase L1-like esterase
VIKKILITIAISLCVFIVAAELFFESAVIPMEVKNDRLVFSPNPKFPGHDRWGFRNDNVPEKADIVCIGDSQTYGIGALDKNYTWPGQFKALTNLRVYNMAFGGYGPVQESILLEKALSLKPRAVIEAFYAGNDLYDSYAFVYRNRKMDSMISHDKNAVNLFTKLDRENPLERQIDITSWACNNYLLIQLNKFCKSHNLFLTFIADHIFSANGSSATLGQFRAHHDFYDIFSNKKSTFIFTPRYRLVAENLKDPRINEGLRISLDALAAMGLRCKKAGVDFIVLLLPTKEGACRDIVGKDYAQVSPAYHELIADEITVFSTIKDFLKQKSIKFIDASEALRSAIDNGMVLYPASTDGHPNIYGYRTIAEAVYAGATAPKDKN